MRAHSSERSRTIEVLFEVPPVPLRRRSRTMEAVKEQP